jgi:putative tryptophan/tyrosine transport system substrate-binding protein
MIWLAADFRCATLRAARSRVRSHILSPVNTMRRRDLITGIAGLLTAWPIMARGQQSAMPVVGFLGPGSPETDKYRVTAFEQGLREAGLNIGQNVRIEYRWARNRYDQLHALAAELVQAQVAVIATSSTPAALAAKTVTAKVPIVFETAADPVEIGLVASLSRPGGNVTGITQSSNQTTPKRLELLHELLPNARVMVLLVNPAVPVLAEPQSNSVRSAARTMGLELHVLDASTEGELEAAFVKLRELKASGLVIAGDAFFTSHSKTLAALATRYRVPAVYQWREFAADGGLMSYGSNVTETHRLVGTYAARILKGDRPADLPVQQATKVELYINLRTAKALGISVPLPLSGRADELFE